MSGLSVGERARRYFAALQDDITKTLRKLDPRARFAEDRWSHDAGQGGGITRVLQDGALFEKGGVNFSAIEGPLSARLAERLQTKAHSVRATGISLVIHPLSPMIPTVHMNLRHLEIAEDDAWFGGGADLTPYYLFDDDAVHFHRALKQACDAHDPAYYPRFKKECDDYFRVQHRDEARGIGGIFFDYQRETPEETFAFVRDVGDAFLGAYLPIVKRRKDEPWGEKERTWQSIRRGRYVEFNLVYDRGTLFGLETKGRIESILMSLPPKVEWRYDHHPEQGSREENLLEVLKTPKNWI